jgi:MFS transporter, UMF1 family
MNASQMLPLEKSPHRRPDSDCPDRQTESGNEPNTSRAGLSSWALYDWGNSAYWTVIQTFIFPPYFTQEIAADQESGSRLWGTMLGIAGLVVAIGAPFLGAVADQTGRRKPWIGLFTLLTILSIGFLWFVEPSPDFLWPALLLVGIGTVTFECASVFYNAMLPGLVPESRVGRWSGLGWSAGYAGGLACLLLAGLLFLMPEQLPFGLDRDRGGHIRATALLVAAWYLLFALPLFVFTPDVPASGKGLRRAMKDGYSQLLEMITEIRPYRGIVHFLIAMMIYLNGLVALFAFGGIYAATVFGMSEGEIVIFGLALNVAALLGSAGFGWIDDRIGGKLTILWALAGLTLSMMAVLLVESRLLFWVFGLLLGVFVGPAQASSRSYLSRMAPASLRNQMFGLHAFAGKVTAFLGPLVVGWTTGLTGSHRLGMSTILVFVVVGFVLMLKAPSDRKGPSGVPTG